MTPLLTICIPTLPEPKSQQHLVNLMAILLPQIGNYSHETDIVNFKKLEVYTSENVEIVIDSAPRYIPTGTKRNHMYENALGKYVVSVDVDDWIDPDYVSEFLKATESDPDVITLEGWYTENGRNRVDWVIKLGEKYEARHENGKYMFFRFPNHLAAIRKSIATQVRFPDVWQGEDYAFALALKERNLLKTSVHIQKQLYHYAYLTDK